MPTFLILGLAAIVWLYKDELFYDMAMGKNLKFVEAYYQANGQTYGEPADYTLHQLLLTKELQDKEDLLGKEHKDLAQTLHKLALTYFAQGEFEEARSLWQRAKNLNDKFLPPEDAQALEAMRCLAILALYPLNQQAEVDKILADLGKRNRAFLAETLNDLSAICLQLKKYGKAAKAYKQAIELWQKELGAEDAAIPDMLDNLAGLYYYEGKFDQAEAVCREAMDMANRVLGSQHPETAKITSNYAIVKRKN